MSTNLTEANVKSITIGTRKSALAMVQTNIVKSRLEAKYPKAESSEASSATSVYEFKIQGMTTTGDNIQNIALSKIGEKALFTKELEAALENGDVDMVVHSLKDLPSQLPKGMEISVILEREDPRDAVIIRKDLVDEKGIKSLKQLPDGSIVGTGSVRRVAQLQRLYPRLVFQSIRGNIDTRLKKLDHPSDFPLSDGSPGVEYLAIVLAVAGVKRMGMSERINEYLGDEEVMHAVGQGAIAIETRENDQEVLPLVNSLNCRRTRIACMAERSLMRTLEGGCSVPIGVSTSWTSESPSNARFIESVGQAGCRKGQADPAQTVYLVLAGTVCNLDGSEVLQDRVYANVFGIADPNLSWADLTETQRNAEDGAAGILGKALADIMIEKGAKKILGNIRN
ncbi:porphobilinogen deaminase [Mycoemilia scoparia]|uniref:hydroxymethylbilane synthase n=1 Tax=Mycoemilia scoparia TaxID=417184 RepID=A0A9W8DRQ9_9FUNG|nr:porphobilinogen deaminase [Mycoemilia scoparia]